ncbi:hypothetical protein BST92_10715 [Nonlabens arenilitoris]|uniref:Uncharacterized protein n=1 Tax=Nonlabens arenilitoris TaxID=1217969 RepID=A0A2S7UBW6_9FLAO|nr:hypothetical protein [Nonlabens arenilitoris]PQJ32369.1 hypothetical protein BST92_10715 [Nonlabens arenilitoris]
MKILKALSLTAVLFMFLTSFTALVGDSPHVGRWKGEDKGDMGFLELTSDGYATFEFEGQKMGGQSYVSDGVELAMTYKIDKKQSPAHIDFIMIDKSTDAERGRLKGIIEMKSHDQMHLAIGFGGGSRPTDFTVDALLFSRVK